MFAGEVAEIVKWRWIYYFSDTGWWKTVRCIMWLKVLLILYPGLEKLSGNGWIINRSTNLMLKRYPVQITNKYIWRLTFYFALKLKNHCKEIWKRECKIISNRVFCTMWKILAGFAEIFQFCQGNCPLCQEIFEHFMSYLFLDFW